MKTGLSSMTTTEAPGPQNVDDAVTIEGSDRSLSKDCLFECLLFVPHYALSRTAILVCKQWHALYESPEFRKAREIIDDDAQRCPVCLMAWNVNVLTRPLEEGASYDQTKTVRECCCKYTCYACYRKARRCACPLCRVPCALTVQQKSTRLRNHAEKGNPVAIYERAVQLENEGQEREAARLYRLAADKVPEAAYELGEIYDAPAANSYDLVRDEQKAVDFFRMAAERGHAKAQCELSDRLSGTAAAESFQWLKLAADQGYTRGEYEMGRRYERGDAVVKDFTKARRWYERAAAKWLDPGRERVYSCAKSALRALGRLRRREADPGYLTPTDTE